MRPWWRRRAPAPVQIRDPRLHLAPVEIKHEIRHVHEPRPRPDSVKLIFECDGRIFQAQWPNVAFDHHLEVPSFLMAPGAQPIKLRLLPEYWRH